MDQESVFKECGLQNLVDLSLKGYACTVFAFGQTGSGKTHTITGPLHLVGKDRVVAVVVVVFIVVDDVDGDDDDVDNDDADGDDDDGDEDDGDEDNDDDHGANVQLMLLMIMMMMMMKIS